MHNIKFLIGHIQNSLEEYYPYSIFAIGIWVLISWPIYLLIAISNFVEETQWLD